MFCNTKRIPGGKLTEKNNRKISHFWKEKKVGNGGRSILNRKGELEVPVPTDRQALVTGQNWTLKKEIILVTFSYNIQCLCQ